MVSPSRDYAAFLARLAGYERIQAFPQSRAPEKLAGMRWLAEQLEHPERAAPVVHVAGTNGKGTTCAMIANLLQAEGHKVGLYTSPHVADLRERIVVNGKWIAEERLAQVGHAVLDLADGAGDRVYCSYFDLLTAMGLAAFREEQVDWIVLETGLGGLSDATNIGPKRLAVITRIGYDHMYVLGGTLKEIAAQKLGIVRAGVPTVLAGQEPELQEWMADQIRASYSQPVPAWHWQASLVQGKGGTDGEVRITWPDGSAEVIGGLPPVSQVQLACVGTALAAAETVLGAASGPQRAARARKALTTQLPGRLERRGRQRVAGTALVLEQVVMDGGHNSGALRMLADQLDAWELHGYTLIFGMQADKLVEQALPPLSRLAGRAARVLIVAPQTARAASAEALQRFVQEALRRGGQRTSQAPPVQIAGDPRSALMEAGNEPARPVVITGSFWMLGDMMRLLEPA